MSLNRFSNRSLRIPSLKNLNFLLYSFRVVDVSRHIKLVEFFVVVPENMRQTILLVCATLEVVHT